MIPVIFALFLLGVHSVCIPDPFPCSGWLDYLQANRRDCSRFVHCSFGQPRYFQCKRSYVYDSCVKRCVSLVVENERYQCYNATDAECVAQVERPYDKYQAESQLSLTGSTGELIDAVVDPNVNPPPINPINPIMPTNPNGPNYPGYPGYPMIGSPYGNGFNQGGLEFSMNLNYQPFLGWGLNTNLGLVYPWMSFNPMALLGALGGMNGMNGMYGMGQPMYRKTQRETKKNKQFPYFPQPNPYRSSYYDTNAVLVPPCLPNDPWPTQ